MYDSGDNTKDISLHSLTGIPLASSEPCILPQRYPVQQLSWHVTLLVCSRIVSDGTALRIGRLMEILSLQAQHKI